ncbi:plasmodesmata-located protein 2-like [Lycium ferocissimum]|uniref:plasmodesmata-located protein 2-like n=1 Tax=Lycium ferocissimum TaxID=112874 RepID=UPI002814B351|nr:plasmodesmata-located protein 2-like [Lycium ferocissimum]
MGLPKKPFCCIFSVFLVILAIFKLIAPVESASGDTTLVYKGCAKQALSDPSGVYSQALSTLFGSLVSQSSKSKFYKTTTGTGGSTITGLFQCIGDLSNVDCYKCVNGLPILIDKLCGNPTPVAARIQLLGCYMLYEVSGFPQISGMEMLYKTCSGKNNPGSGFEEKRDTAFSTLENGMASASNGFYTANYESIFVLGQCEGDVGNSDCAECVKNAVQKAQVECGSSVSGQIFLHKCFVSFNYYPNGAPKKPSASSNWYPSASAGQDTGKTVAIILGGAAGVAFLVICMLFARNQMKKHDDY